jgi:hypothetical protein
MKIKFKRIITTILIIIVLFGSYKVFISIKESKTSNKSKNMNQNLVMGTAIFTSPDTKIGFPYLIVKSGLNMEQTKTFNDFTLKFAEKVYDSQRGEIPSQWDGSVVAERADSKIISARMQAVQYFGGAHPNTTNYVINYSVRDSKEIFLEDIFDTKAGYLNTLSSLVKTKLVNGFKKEGVDTNSIESMIDDGTKPDSKNFQKFIIGDFYTTFVYDPYEVAPYTYGTRQAMISFDELKGTLRADLTK